MKVFIIPLILFVAAPPAFAISEAEQDQIDRSIAGLKERLEDNRRQVDDIHALRNADRKKSCTKLGGAAIGMTATQILASCWGKPRHVNATVTARGNHEQWVYIGGYIYLDDGVVTSIQTTR